MSFISLHYPITNNATIMEQTKNKHNAVTTQPNAKVHGMKLVLVSMVGIGGNECLGLYDNAKITKRNRL